MRSEVVVTLVSTCCFWAADFAVAAEPRTLEEALVGYTWEWTHAPKPPDQLTFTADGIAVCHRFSWQWKIVGPWTVEAFDAWSEGKASPNFQAQLTFDPTFRTLEGEAGGGKWRYTGRRLVVTPSDEQALRDAVCGASWTWILDQPHPDPWDERRFEPNGRATASRRGELMCTGQWEITGPRTVRIQNITPQRNIHILSFSGDLTEFVGVDGKGINRYRGNIKAGAAPKPRETAALPPIQTDPNQPRIEVIREQGPNAIEWALAPLDEPLPANIRQNLTYLREDLLDEATGAPKAPEEAYNVGSEYCDEILQALELREQARVQGGYRAAQADADIKVTNSQLDARRNYQMSWPQYQREESQRAALREQETNRADLKKERLKVDWNTRTAQMRTALDDQYRRLREAKRRKP